MKESELMRLLENQVEVDKKLRFFLGKRLLFKQEINLRRIEGHIAKLNHDLSFVNSLKNEYNDWTLVGCYYALYHIALALILSKGLFSKNHDATLTALIKYFYRDFPESDIRFLNSLEINDILFYAQSRNEREKASYSSSYIINNKTVNEIKLKTILFVNKAKEILEF